MTTLLAPVNSAAQTAPSSTRCGADPSSTLSLALVGSPSTPFAMTTGERAALASARSFAAAGEGGPTSPGQVRSRDLVDELLPALPVTGAGRAGAMPGLVLAQAG